MDLATLLGLVAGILVMGGAIALGGNPLQFVDTASLVIVMGGTFAAVLMKFSLGQFLGAMKVALRAFLYKAESPDELIEAMAQMAEKARKEGFLALEGMEVANPFLKKGLQMLADGHAPAVIREVLTKDLNQMTERHQAGQKIFKAIGDAAPAMGMIGTLIGLVQMLSTMEDPSTIGPSMAVALLTTLYGAMIANMVALPIADKLAMRSKEERNIKNLVVDGLNAMQAGHNPRVVKELLVCYLPPNKRTIDDE